MTKRGPQQGSHWAGKGIKRPTKMLAKPGSGSSGGRLRATASTRRKTAESPDDAIRKLSKQAANKRCADCTTKVRKGIRGMNPTAHR